MCAATSTINERTYVPLPHVTLSLNDDVFNIEPLSECTVTGRGFRSMVWPWCANLYSLIAYEVSC
jgi:hypothetical protein